MVVRVGIVNSFTCEALPTNDCPRASKTGLISQTNEKLACLGVVDVGYYTVLE